MSCLLLFVPLLTQAPELLALRAAAEAKLKEIYAAGTFPGATFSAVLPDGRSFSLAVGMADLEKKIPMAENQPMLAGSTGKTFFAAWLFQLVDDGVLDLDKKVSAYVGKTQWFDKLPNAQELTLRVLLNHTSGIAEHVGSAPFIKEILADPEKAWKHEELLKFTVGGKALFEVGKDWAYADTNYIVAALVAETVTGKDAYVEIRRRILSKLKLPSTAPSVSRKISGVAQGYSMPNSPFLHTGPVFTDGKHFINPQMEWAGGGFVSSTLDLATWIRALMDAKVFSKEMLSHAMTGVLAKTGPNHKYGLGLQIRPTEWGDTYGHSGWFPGFLSDTQYFPKTGYTFSVQFNTDEMRRIGKSPHRVLLEIAKVVMPVPTP